MWPWRRRTIKATVQEPSIEVCAYADFTLKDFRFRAGRIFELLQTDGICKVTRLVFGDREGPVRIVFVFGPLQERTAGIHYIHKNLSEAYFRQHCSSEGSPREAGGCYCRVSRSSGNIRLEFFGESHDLGGCLWPNDPLLGRLEALFHGLHPEEQVVCWFNEASL